MKPVYVPIPLLGLCCLFLLLGLLLIPYAGIQNDEALFSIPIHQNQFEFKIRLLRHDIPLMVMSYIGTLKTGLYWVWFKLWPPSPYSTRLPMVALGSFTIFLFFYLARKIVNPIGAWVGAILLATDPSFLLTNTFDWGPVAIEHFLLVAGCLFLARFAEDAAHGEPRSAPGIQNLAWGFFVLGLALWNKAIFLASLAALTVAAGTVCWRQIASLWTGRRLRVAILAFLAGCAPVLLYNARRPATTLRSNANLEMPEWSVKVPQLLATLNGSDVFGYLTSDDRTHPNPVVSPQGRASEWLQMHFGEWRRGGLLAACGVCLLLLPLWWRSAAARFSLIFCAVHWCLIIVMRGGGTSAHHVVLMWPFPHLFVAATLSQVPWRPLGKVAAGLIASTNLLVISQYMLQFERDGAGPIYSDALTRLSGRLPQYSAHTIYVMDWGMQNSLAMLHEGRMPLYIAESAFRDENPPESEIEVRQKILVDRGGILLGYREGWEIFVGGRARIEQEALKKGLRKEVIEIVEDSHRRPVFEIYRLKPF